MVYSIFVNEVCPLSLLAVDVQIEAVAAVLLERGINTPCAG